MMRRGDGMEFRNKHKKRKTPGPGYKTHRPSPIISDHCVIRYLERIKGMDIEAIRTELLTDELKRAIEVQVKTIVIDGVKFYISNKRVTTCY